MPHSPSKITRQPSGLAGFAVIVSLAPCVELGDDVALTAGMIPALLGACDPPDGLAAAVIRNDQPWAIKEPPDLDRVLGGRVCAPWNVEENHCALVVVVVVAPLERGVGC